MRNIGAAGSHILKSDMEMVAELESFSTDFGFLFSKWV